MNGLQRITSFSADETKIIGERMAKVVKSNMVIALYGDLGTGKTTFTQGFAMGLGINENVNSPTFKLVSEYAGDSKRLYHIDCYRMTSSNEFLNIGGESFLRPGDGEITIIEWANIIEKLLQPGTLTIKFERNIKKPSERILEIIGQNYEDISD